MLRRAHIGISWLLLLILVPLLGLGACRPQEIDLPFETIEQKEWAGTGQAYEAREPGLMVIARPEEAARLNDWITENAKTRLQTLDYDTGFALVVFQGWKLTTRYGVQMERVTRQENTVTAYAQLQKPKSGEPTGGEITSPYHLIWVQKIGAWDQNITFNLVVDGAVVVSLSRHIP